MTIKKYIQFIRSTNLAVKDHPHPLEKMAAEGISPSLQRILESAHTPFAKRLQRLYAFSVVVCCLGIGTIFQANQAYEQVISVSGHYATVFLQHRWFIGVIFAALLGLVIIGSVHAIMRITLKSIPLITLMYFVTGCNVLAINQEQLSTAIFRIVIDAFDTPTLAAGILGVLFIGCRQILFFGKKVSYLNTSFNKINASLLSRWQNTLLLIDVFIDSVAIFIMMGLILMATLYQNDLVTMGKSLSGVAISIHPAEANPGWFDYIGVLLTLTFVFTSLIASSYYGLRNWHILVGESRQSTLLFKLLFCVAVVLGCVVKSDTMPFLLAFVILVIAIPQILGWFLVLPYDYFISRLIKPVKSYL